MLADANLGAAVHRRQNADKRKEASPQIRERHASFRGRSPRLAGNRHEAGNPLSNDVESALVPVRPGVSIPGNRGVDQARVDGCQRLVVQSQGLHRGGSIVLD